MKKSLIVSLLVVFLVNFIPLKTLAGGPGDLVLKDVHIDWPKVGSIGTCTVSVGGMDSEEAARYKDFRVEYTLTTTESNKVINKKGFNSLVFSERRARMDLKKDGVATFSVPIDGLSGEYWIVAFLAYRDEVGNTVRVPDGKNGVKSNKFTLW